MKNQGTTPPQSPVSFPASSNPASAIGSKCAKQGPFNPRLIDKPSLLIWGEKDSIVSLRTAEGEKIRLRGLHPPF